MKEKLFNYSLLFFLMSLFSLSSQAQEIHGYSMVIANELSDHNFIITKRGFINDDESIYYVHMKTSDFYDDDLTRMTITTVLGLYSDIQSQLSA